MTSIAYDGFLPTALSWSGPVAGEVQWTYNDRFLIETETIGALPATTVSYQYDPDGLVTQAGDLSIQRDPTSGRVVTKTIGNIRESFDYNEFAELSRQTVVLLDGMGAVKETLYDVIYDDDGANGDRDALGRITKKTEWIVSDDEPNSDGTARDLDARTYDYGYNPDGRPWLESVAVDGNVVSSYDYDPNGNRIAAELSWSQLGYDTTFDASLTPADTQYNAADQLLAYGSKSYTWNNFGQLESMTDSDPNGDGDTSDSATTTYEYDLYGNLLSVGLPDGRTIEYDVDGAGRRVGRRELDPSGNEISFRGWIYRDDLRPLAEVDAVGNVVARYVYRQSGGENHPEYVVTFAPDGPITGTYALVMGPRGSMHAAIDAATGQVVQRRQYDAWGRILSDTTWAFDLFGFAGGMQDRESETVKFGFREYHTELGRWLTRDPILFAGNQENLYQYASSDPVNWKDPDGKCVPVPLFIPLIPPAAQALGWTAATVGAAWAGLELGQQLDRWLAKKRDIQQVDRVAKDRGFDRAQRRRLHDLMDDLKKDKDGGGDLTWDEINDAADQVEAEAAGRK